MNTYKNKVIYTIEYIAVNLILFFLIFKFSNIVQGIGYIEAKVPLFFAVLISSAAILWSLLTMEKRRDRFSIFVFTLIPYFVFISVLYIRYWHFIYIILAITVILMGLYIVYITKRYKKSKGRESRENHGKNDKALIAGQIVFGCCTIVAIMSISLLCPLITNAIFGKPEIKVVSPSHEYIYRTGENTISKHKKEIMMLDDGTWGQLNSEQRLSVLKTVADIECNYLGMEQVDVEAKKMKKERWAVYNPDDDVVILNTMRFEGESKSQDILKTLLHEIYHKYERCLVEAYNQVDDENKELRCLYRAGEYEQNMLNYSKPDKDREAFEDYYNQAMEEDARYYAEYGYKEYYERIEEFKKENETKKN